MGSPDELDRPSAAIDAQELGGIRHAAWEAWESARAAGEAALRSARDLARLDLHGDRHQLDFVRAVDRNAYGMLIVDAERTVRHANPAAVALLDVPVDELRGAAFPYPLAPDAPVEVEVRRRDGSRAVAEMQAVETVWEGAAAWLVSLHDVSARVRAQQRLADQALRDRLTGVAARELFVDRLEHALSEARRPPHPGCAVLFVDLDRFKEINDNFGHHAGDEALRSVAQRLVDCVRPGDTVGRLGGDEFAVVLQRCDDSAGARRVGERILAALTQPVQVGSTEVVIGASVGVAFGGPEERHADELLADADRAMYHGKALGGGRVTIFDEAMHRQGVWRERLEADLRAALERGELRVHYQPVVDLTTERIEGFEALVRWEHPIRGLIPPSEFLPLAERVGLIEELGRFVLRDGCRQLRTWRRDDLIDDELTLTINVSPRELASAAFADGVAAVLDETGLPAANLRLDVREATLMGLEHRGERLGRLATAGVRLNVDDFGSGYSALRDLGRLPLAALKLDRDLVAGLVDGLSADLIQATVALAHALGLRVVAEGVETPQQAEALRKLGCDAMQGFVVAAPLAPTEAEDLLPI